MHSLLGIFVYIIRIIAMALTINGYYYTVPPITRFPGNNQNQELGIVHQQVTITIAVDNASPDVLPAHTGWQFKGVNAGTVTVLENSKHMFSADRRSLTITDLSHDDEGQYTVTVRNPAGSDMITVNLAIEGNIGTIDIF